LFPSLMTEQDRARGKKFISLLMTERHLGRSGSLAGSCVLSIDIFACLTVHHNTSHQTSYYSLLVDRVVSGGDLHLVRRRARWCCVQQNRTSTKA
jgi:hypothetical protein